MKITLFFLIPLAFVAFLLAGGIYPFNVGKEFGLPGLPTVNPNDVVDLIDKGGSYGAKRLQIGTLDPIGKKCISARIRIYHAARNGRCIFRPAIYPSQK